MSIKMSLKKIVDRGNGWAELVEEFPELKDFQCAWLGDWNRLVVTDQQGIYFARLVSGEIVNVVNEVRVPPIPDLRVIVGKEKALFGKRCIVRIYEEALRR